MSSSTFYRRTGKRLFDLVVAGVLSLILLPLMVFVGMAVAIFLGRPVLFRQQRPGKDGKIFTLCKFRTMTDGRDAEGNLLPDAERLTRFGKFLRSSSLDELPELLNILRGEMSLVGPRPLLVEYLSKYSERQARRHEAVPGVTGWAQVNGRNGVPWEERFEMDVWYCENCSLGLDLKILWMTVATILNRKGVSAEGHVTMPPFGTTPETTSETAPRSAA